MISSELIMGAQEATHARTIIFERHPETKKITCTLLIDMSKPNPPWYYSYTCNTEAQALHGALQKYCKNFVHNKRAEQFLLNNF